MSPRRPPARVFAIVPIIGFLLQEHLEHIVAARELEVTFFLTAPFLLGLALQVPFALAALLVARLILGLVARVVRAVGVLGIVPGLASLRFSSRSSPSLLLARRWPRTPPAAHLLASADQNESAGRPCGRPGCEWEG